ncbi:ribosomal RNA-processing protein 17 [Cornus florida]|uniref:ribosomal RNA-processing protein 17 n=1 Tax=Cornus florida TaxID=4283 RepID=UPI0028999B86|nr:ribosomal RNA-processing protein 17 [Cornus florida]
MEDDEASQPRHTQARHIKKRALKNKALSVSFDEKDLRDYVTGFHKRKKKRRKEAQEQLQEVVRRKRIDARKKRKLEREYVQSGGAPPDTVAEPDECGEQSEHDEEIEPIPSVSGTTMYDNGDVKVTVTTSEISREEESPYERSEAPAAPISVGAAEKKKHKMQVSKKKPFKKVSKHRSRSKTQNKRDKRKGKMKNNKL